MGGRLLIDLVSESDVNRCCSFYDQVIKTESADNVYPVGKIGEAKSAKLPFTDGIVDDRVTILEVQFQRKVDE